MVRQALEPSTALSTIAPCEHYSSVDYEKYIKGIMPVEAIQTFEAHCWDCPSCLKGIVASHQKYLREKDQSENEALFGKTEQLLDKLERNVIEVVIKKSMGILQLIRTTGEIIHRPTVPAFRGERDEPKEEQALLVMQEYVLPPLSVQASFKTYKSEDEIGLTISIFNKESEEFMPGIKITLKGTDIEETMITDENGTATLLVKGSGEYRVGLQADGEPLGILDITVKG
jgi:hypothetical protein